MVFATQTAIATGDGAMIMGPTNTTGNLDCEVAGQVVNVQNVGFCQTTSNTSSQIYYVNGTSTTSTSIEVVGYINPHVAPNF